MRTRAVIIADFENWKGCVVRRNDPDTSFDLKYTMRYVYVYLRHGSGSFIHRVISVFKRLMTASLKPSHEASRKRGQTVSPRTSTATE